MNKQYITFFKSTYKKYTNFAIEPIEEYFDGNIDFGEHVTCSISKYGHLISKMYVKIELPKLNVKLKQTNTINTFIKRIEDEYEICKKFIKLVQSTLIQIDNLKVNNVDMIKLKLTAARNSNKNVYENISSKDIYKTLLINIDVFTQINNVTDIKTFSIRINNNIRSIHKKYADKLKLLRKCSKSSTYDFNWVHNLGHYIIDSISIQMGGTSIADYDSTFANIYHDMHKNINHTETYDKMIGNVPNIELLGYTLYIPIYFWFSEDYGLSIPVAAMKCSDINIDIYIASLNDCAIFDQTFDQSQVKITNMTLIVEYVYVDISEKKRIIDNTHEYLISQYQTYNSQLLKPQKVLTFTIDFLHPIKTIIWVVQSQLNIDYGIRHIYGTIIAYNITGINSYNDNCIEIVIDNHIIKVGSCIKIIRTNIYDGNYEVISVTDNSVIVDTIFQNVIITFGILLLTDDNANINLGNPVEKSSIMLKGNMRFISDDAKFSSLVQNYEFGNSSIDEGINQCSLALYPLITYQPSGSMDFDTLKKAFLDITLSDLFMEQINIKNDNIKVSIYAINYNIIIFKNGRSTLLD